MNIKILGLLVARFFLDLLINLFIINVNAR
jgi:hypothetical protein